jgi:5-formyltetrahydrofolate cyclo-ligase
LRQGFRVTDFADPAAAKAAVRDNLLAERRRLPARRLADNAARVQATLRQRLDDLLAGEGAGTGAPVVAGYVPVGPEPGGPDLPEALRRALPPETRLLLPVLRDDLDLDWARYTGTLAPAGQGLREPPGPLLGTAAVAGAALLVVPAVAVDRRGVRLGRGGGSYDRALARAAPHARIVALLHDGELRPEDLPAEPHDRRVGAVITPTAGLVRLP